MKLTGTIAGVVANGTQVFVVFPVEDHVEEIEDAAYKWFDQRLEKVGVGYPFESIFLDAEKWGLLGKVATDGPPAEWWVSMELDRPIDEYGDDMTVELELEEVAA